MDTAYDRKSVRKQIKKQAKSALHRDIWGNIALEAPILILAYLQFFISYMSDGSRSTASFIFLLMAIIIGLILTIYATYVQSFQSLKQMQSDEEVAQPTKSWFKTYLKQPWQRTIWLSVWMLFIFTIGWIVLVIIGDILTQTSFLFMIIASLNYMEPPAFAYVLLVFGLILMIGFFVVGIMKWYKYIIVPFVGYDNPSLKGFQLIAESRKLMRGRRWELFVMQLSFFWWILLSMVTLGLASFYTAPYMALTLAGYFDVLKTEQEKQEQAEVATEAPVNSKEPIVLIPNKLD